MPTNAGAVCCQNISGKVHLVTKVCRLHEPRASLRFRQGLASKTREMLRPIASIHAPRKEGSKEGAETGKHQTSSEEKVLDLAAAVPYAPGLPAAIHDALVATGPQAALRTTKPACFLTPAGAAAEYGTATRVKIISAPSNKPPSSFESEAPGRLNFANMCTKGFVVVGPSLHVPFRSGLYPAKNFVKGETVCSGASVDGGWVRVKPGEKESEFTLRLHVHHIFSRGFSLCMPLRRPPEERRSPRVRPVVGASWAPIGGPPLWELILGLLGGGLSGLLS